MSNNVPYYEKEGRRYDRITHILDYFSPPGLVDWKIRVGRKEAGMISRAALRIGSNVDDSIREHVGGCRTIGNYKGLKTQEAINCYKAFEDWKKDHVVEYLAIVGTTFNDELMVAGTPDLFRGDKLTIVDVKCSSKIRESYWLQTEFYARSSGCLNKAILRLDKNLGIFEYKEMPLCDEHWDAVKGAIKLYRYYKSIEEDGKGDQDECNANITDTTQ